MQVAAGELSESDRLALDRTIRLAEESCRFEFSVYVGPAEAGGTRRSNKASRPGDVGAGGDKCGMLELVAETSAR